MLIVLLILAIAFIVISTTKFKLHPFLALIIAAIGYGLCSGIPLDKIISSVNNGFGSTVSSIGIVIVVGIVMTGVPCAVFGPGIPRTGLLRVLFGFQKGFFHKTSGF